jgi:DOPA 4,5-dioxygenase
VFVLDEVEKLDQQVASPVAVAQQATDFCNVGRLNLSALRHRPGTAPGSVAHSPSPAFGALWHRPATLGRPTEDRKSPGLDLPPLRRQHHDRHAKEDTAAMTETPQDVATIQAWHAHVYYDVTTRPAADRLRAQVGERFPTARLGRWHDAPVGPHPTSIYQIAFTPDDAAALIPFLALNRHGLTVLVHPETGRPRADHLHHALWMGAVLPLDASVLPESGS